MSVFDFSCRTMDGELVSLDQYRGNVLLIVNTASKCGFTPQYNGLESLYRNYRQRGLVVMGFPCDQFLHQEFDSEDEIERFCVNNYNITFPLFGKVRVRGDEVHPLFRYLREAAPGWFGTRSIKWNFTKFLVDRGGTPVRRFATTAYPSHLRGPIERLLNCCR